MGIVLKRHASSMFGMPRAATLPSDFVGLLGFHGIRDDGGYRSPRRAVLFPVTGVVWLVVSFKPNGSGRDSRHLGERVGVGEDRDGRGRYDEELVASHE